MSETPVQVKLQDGTLIRHKVTGYEGRIDGITEIKTCFTAGGAMLDRLNTKQTFQYRVVIKGEPMRRIAPAEDLEILEGAAVVICPYCHLSFKTKPGFADKPRSLRVRGMDLPILPGLPGCGRAASMPEAAKTFSPKTILTEKGQDGLTQG